MFAMENLGRPAGLVVGPFFVGAVAGWAGGVEGWRWAMVAVAIPALIVAVVLLFVREPERGRNEQEAILGRLLDSSQDPPVRLSAAAARLRKVKSFRYLILGIGVLGFALVSVPVRLSFLLDETYHFDAYKRGWVLSLTYLPALLVIPFAGRMGDRLFRRDPRNAVRIFGVLVIAYGVFLTIGSQLERDRAVHRVRRDRQRVPARRVHAGRARRSRRSSRTGCARRRSRSSASTSSCSVDSSAASRSRRSPTTTASAPRCSSSSRPPR